MKDFRFRLPGLVVGILSLLLGVGLALSCDDDDDDDDDSSGTTGPDDDSGDDDSSGSLIDNGDGTATDPSSGLTWEITPSSGSVPIWTGYNVCDGLTLAGGGWRVPTIWELRSLIRGCAGTVTGGDCGVTDECTNASGCWNGACLGCDYMAGPGSGGAYWPPELSGEIISYWSFTPVAESVYEWGVSFGSGKVDRFYNNMGPPDDDDAPDTTVRCVRGDGADDDDDNNDNNDIV